MDTPRVLMGPYEECVMLDMPYLQEAQNTQYWYSTSVADQYGTCSTTDQGAGEYINLDFMFQQSDQQSKLTYVLDHKRLQLKIPKLS